MLCAACPPHSSTHPPAIDTPTTTKEIKKITSATKQTHIKNVLEYFKDRPDDLIVFNIETDNIDKLINFFNKFDIILYEKYWGKFNARR